MIQPAANDSPFEPLATSDPAFVAWLQRVAMRLRNTGGTADDVWRGIVADGVPSSEWAQALLFHLTMALANKHKKVVAGGSRMPAPLK